MKYINLALVFVFMVGCSSVQKLTNVDSKLDSVQGSAGNDKVIGVKDDVAVIQEKRSGEDELRLQLWKNYQLENDLNHEFYMTEWCYEDLSDPRLGGNGEVALAPEMKKIKNSVAVKEEIGLEDKRLIVVKTTNFIDQLKVERDYSKSLEDMISVVKRTRVSCERKMGVARLKAGLPAKRYQGKAVITPAGTIDRMLAPNENSLDDAFQIKELGDNKAKAD
jgi:hypothetical protein